MADLAITYHAQGRYGEAEGIKKQALDLRREVFGEKHPDTIWSMADLAATYYAQGGYNAAEGIYKQALDLRREVLGEKHPDTIRSMADLAATYGAQGRSAVGFNSRNILLSINVVVAEQFFIEERDFSALRLKPT
ncbi:kinesin light chain [Trichoderma velutinum]